MSNWKIKTFDDYHEIYSQNLKTIELGCWPEKGCSYYRYFGLFYSGRKPALKQLWPSIIKRIDFQNDFNDGETVNKDMVLGELKESLTGNIRFKNY